MWHSDSKRLIIWILSCSMGGGTGSGLGSYITSILTDDYPDVYRFVTAVYPSEDDDVVTSPYNSVLAMHRLTEQADCVLPIENMRLADIVRRVQEATEAATMTGGKRLGGVTSSEGGLTRPKDERPFDRMNNVVANLLLNLTSSARFEGHTQR